RCKRAVDRQDYSPTTKDVKETDGILPSIAGDTAITIDPPKSDKGNLHPLPVPLTARSEHVRIATTLYEPEFRHYYNQPTLASQ
ncbi:MAG: hypothetical protein NTU41_02105, partial [Chloroflexi bacterium]|nr:hypothetical protein [Chloroflexota bacterium]